jgi:DNA-directed RNA polymerase specialized sigma24 family protein
MRKDRTLSQRQLHVLLAWLAPTPEKAGERYEAIRSALNRFFASRRCQPPEEFTDDTIDRVARRLADGEQIHTPNPGSYFYGVARNVYREALKQRQGRTDPAHVQEPAVRYVDEPPRLACLRKCLRQLAPESRELLEAYYLDGRTDLAGRLGVSPNAVRLRVFKQKQSLKACIRQCLEREPD